MQFDEPSDDVRRVLVAATGLGFAPTDLATLRLTDEDLADLLRSAARHRLVGALAEMVAAGVWAPPAEQRDAVVATHNFWLLHSLDSERLLLKVVARFEELGIDVRVLKGIALGRLVYDDPAWRVFGDIDVLVHSDDVDRAVTSLIDDFTGERSLPELRPGFDRAFAKEVLVRIGPRELDLHRTLADGPFGLMACLDELFDEAAAFRVGDRTLQAPSPVPMFLHGCFNLALGDRPVRLCSVRDLLLMLQRLELDIDHVIAAAARWRATTVVQRAAVLALEVIPLSRPHPLHQLAALVPPRKERWLLRSYETSARSYSRPLAAAAVVPGFRQKFRYLSALASPGDEYMRHRGWTERGHLRRAFRSLSRGSHG